MPLTAASILATRASAPVNWSGLSQAEINRFLKANIAAWRAAAYSRRLVPQLAPTLGVGAHQVPHLGYGYHTRMRYVGSAAPVAGGRNRNTHTGRRTATAKTFGYAHERNRAANARQNALNTVRYYLRRRLKKTRARKAQTLLLSRAGLGSVRANAGGQLANLPPNVILRILGGMSVKPKSR